MTLQKVIMIAVDKCKIQIGWNLTRKEINNSTDYAYISCYLFEMSSIIWNPRLYADTQRHQAIELKCTLCGATELNKIGRSKAQQTTPYQCSHPIFYSLPSREPAQDVAHIG